MRQLGSRHDREPLSVLPKSCTTASYFLFVTLVNDHLKGGRIHRVHSYGHRCNDGIGVGVNHGNRVRAGVSDIRARSVGVIAISEGFAPTAMVATTVSVAVLIADTPNGATAYVGQSFPEEERITTTDVIRLLHPAARELSTDF